VTHEQLIWQGVTALVTILTVLATYLKTRRQRVEQHGETATKLDDVQRIVNGQSEAQQARVAQLERALVDAGAEVPPTAPQTG
jgi:hypothetical protein